MLRLKSIFAEITLHIRLANRNRKYGDFSSACLFAHHTSSADALLRLLEKEIIGKTRGAKSLRGLTRRLASLEG